MKYDFTERMTLIPNSISSTIFRGVRCTFFKFRRPNKRINNNINTNILIYHNNNKSQAPRCTNCERDIDLRSLFDKEIKSVTRVPRSATISHFNLIDRFGEKQFSVKTDTVHYVFPRSLTRRTRNRIVRR